MWKILSLPLRLTARSQRRACNRVDKINRKQVVGSASFQLTSVGSGGIDTSIPKRRAHTPSLHLCWMQELSSSKGKLERPGHFINRDGFGITWSGSAKPQSFCLYSGVVWGLWGPSGWFPNPRHWYFSCAATWNRTGPHPYSLFLLSCCLVTRWLFCNPMGCNLPSSSVCGISGARILGWGAMFYFRGSFWPGDRTCISYLAVRFFTTDPPGRPSLFLSWWFLFCLWKRLLLCKGLNVSPKICMLRPQCFRKWYCLAIGSLWYN